MLVLYYVIAIFLFSVNIKLFILSFQLSLLFPYLYIYIYIFALPSYISSPLLMNCLMVCYESIFVRLKDPYLFVNNIINLQRSIIEDFLVCNSIG